MNFKVVKLNSVNINSCQGLGTITARMINDLIINYNLGGASAFVTDHSLVDCVGYMLCLLISCCVKNHLALYRSGTEIPTAIRGRERELFGNIESLMLFHRKYDLTDRQINEHTDVWTDKGHGQTDRQLSLINLKDESKSNLEHECLIQVMKRDRQMTDRYT